MNTANIHKKNPFVFCTQIKTKQKRVALHFSSLLWMELKEKLLPLLHFPCPCLRIESQKCSFHKTLGKLNHSLPSTRQQGDDTTTTNTTQATQEN